MSTQLGECASGPQVGMKSPVTYIWIKCPDCSTERWVQRFAATHTNGLCKPCANKRRKGLPNLKITGPLNWKWKGGKYVEANRYTRVLVPADHPLRAMADRRGVIPEHRFVMAMHLGRCLEPWEIVHHKNSIKDDNRLENLELLPDSHAHQPSQHWRRHVMQLERRIRVLEGRVTLLEMENVLLRQDTMAARTTS